MTIRAWHGQLWQAIRVDVAYKDWGDSNEGDLGNQEQVLGHPLLCPTSFRQSLLPPPCRTQAATTNRHETRNDYFSLAASFLERTLYLVKLAPRLAWASSTTGTASSGSRPAPFAFPTHTHTPATPIPRITSAPPSGPGQTPNHRQHETYRHPPHCPSPLLSQSHNHSPGPHLRL